MTAGISMLRGRCAGCMYVIWHAGLGGVLVVCWLWICIWGLLWGMECWYVCVCACVCGSVTRADANTWGCVEESKRVGRGSVKFYGRPRGRSSGYKEFIEVEPGGEQGKV